jgi:hypothetical protein
LRFIGNFLENKYFLDEKENFYSRIFDVMKKANKFTVNEEVLEINKKN